MDFIKWIFVQIFPFLWGVFWWVLCAVLHIKSEGLFFLFIAAWFWFAFYFYDKATTQLSPAYSDENYEKITKSEDERVKKETDKIFVMSIIMIVLMWIGIALQTLRPKYSRYNWTCWDHTSIDWNRQNDFKCVSDDWEVKRMSEEDALEFLDFDSRINKYNPF